MKWHHVSANKWISRTRYGDFEITHYGHDFVLFSTDGVHRTEDRFGSLFSAQSGARIQNHKFKRYAHTQGAEEMRHRRRHHRRAHARRRHHRARSNPAGAIGGFVSKHPWMTFFLALGATGAIVTIIRGYNNPAKPASTMMIGAGAIDSSERSKIMVGSGVGGMVLGAGAASMLAKSDKVKWAGLGAIVGGLAGWGLAYVATPAPGATPSA